MLKCYTLLEVDQNSERRQTVRSSAVGVIGFKPYKVTKKLVVCFVLGNGVGILYTDVSERPVPFYFHFPTKIC